MKAPGNKKTELDEDQDIARVFSAQRVELPDALKQGIFAEADRQARLIATSKAAQNSSHTGSKLLIRNRWFGIAATLLITVGVSPLLFNSPESTLDTKSTAASKGTFDTHTIFDTRTTGEADDTFSLQAADEISVDEESLAEPALLTRKVNPTAAAAPLLAPAPQAQASADSAIPGSMEIEQLEQSNLGNKRPSMKQAKQPEPEEQGGGASGDSAPSQTFLEARPIGSTKRAITTRRARSIIKSTNEKLSYRATPENWMNRIRMLITDADAKAAREEYQLFEEQYPELAEKFKTDFDKEVFVFVPKIDAEELQP